ncbi:hypothetical protein JW948_13465 [bacterium]|nr:hypothetical protein [bacterium]
MTEKSNKAVLEQAINLLTRAIQLYRYYGKEHQVTQEAIQQLYKSIDQALFHEEVITVGIIGDEIAFDKEPMYELSAKKKGFIEYLKSVGVKKMRFYRGLKAEELSRFIEIMPSKAEGATPQQDLLQQFKSLGLEHITIGDIAITPKKTEEPEFDEHFFDIRVRKDYTKNVDYLTKTFKELKGNQTLNVQSARQIAVSLMNNLFKNKNLLLMMTSMKIHDEDTFEHGVNVAIFTLMQGELLGLEKKLLVDVGMAALLHDVGKMADEAPVADTPKSLNDFSFGDFSSGLTGDDSFDQDLRGAKLLLETEGINTLAAITAFEHGMNYDQSGSFTKLYGKDLNLISMMIRISDFYDKLRKEPFFYEAGGPEKAYDMMMQESGKKFHPDLLENFFSVIGIFPPGTLVELDTGETGLVIQSSVFDIRRPQVEILYDNQGNRFRNPMIANLVEKDRRGQYKRSIVRSIAPLEKMKMQENFI